MRLNMSMTQEEIARALGVSQFTISRWECGAHDVEHPTMLRRALRQIARDRLGRSVDAILESWEIPAPKKVDRLKSVSV